MRSNLLPWLLGFGGIGLALSSTGPVQQAAQASASLLGYEVAVATVQQSLRRLERPQPPVPHPEHRQTAEALRGILDVLSERWASYIRTGTLGDRSPIVVLLEEASGHPGDTQGGGALTLAACAPPWLRELGAQLLALPWDPQAPAGPQP